MINVLVIVMEGIAAWLCLHCAFGEKIKKSKGEIIFFLFYISLFVLCSFGILSRLFYILFWVFAFIWCKVMFGRKNLSTIVRTAIGIVAVGVIETLVMFGYSLIFISNKIPINLECIAMSGLTIIIVFYVYSRILYKKHNIDFHLFDKWIYVFGLMMLLFLLYVKLEYEVNRKVSNIYVFFFAIISMAFVILYRKQKSIFELEKKNLKYELDDMYGRTYEDLLKEVRRRQHDYKNQLIAISSAYIGGDSFEEVKKMYEKYIGIIEDESEYDHILTKCNNCIIAGYLYNMALKLKNEKIKLRIKVNVREKSIDIKTKDVIEILGILFVNATEYIKDNFELNRCIDLELYQEEDKFLIEVRNPTKYISYNNLGKMFDDGFSTKGDNRGMGLYSLKYIVEKYKGELRVENVKDKSDNWLQFNISI